MSRVRRVLEHPLYVEKTSQLTELEKDRIWCRHGMDHLITVARLAYIFNLERGYDISKDLIYATGLLHDIGRSTQYLDGTPHARAGVPLADEILRDAGYTEDEISLALQAIAEHSDETPYERTNRLSEIIYDADKQSRDCFNCKVNSQCNWDPFLKNQTVIW